MSLADRIGDWTLRHPDRLLAVIGGVGGFALGTMNLGFSGGLAMALVSALFTLAIANITPKDPALAPHQ